MSSPSNPTITSSPEVPSSTSSPEVPSMVAGNPSQREATPNGPSYCKTSSVYSLVTYSFPSGPNFMSSGSFRPPLPAETKASMKAPVEPSYRNTSSELQLLT